VNDRDIGMTESSERFGFPAEARESVRVWAKAVADFDGHLAAECRIPRAVHLSPCTRAKESGHFIDAEARAGLKRHRRGF
jgi:hypothetical protein